jgi:hypothetical protein
MADTLIKQLKALPEGQPKRIRGLAVQRDGGTFTVDGDEMDLDSAIQRLHESSAPKSGIEYNWTLFVEQEPGHDPAQTPVKLWRCADRAKHTTLAEAVKSRKNYLWYGKVIEVNGRHRAVGPFLLDFDTVPDQPYVIGASGRRELPAPPPPDPSQWDGACLAHFAVSRLIVPRGGRCMSSISIRTECLSTSSSWRSSWRLKGRW